MRYIELTKNRYIEQPKVYKSFQQGARLSEGGGGGDMTRAIYDPTSVNGDAFDMDNMSEGASSKILTVAERDQLTRGFTKVGGVSRDTDPYSNLTATTIDFSDMYDNLDTLDDHNESLWTFGTGIISTIAGPGTGVTLFANPAAGESRIGKIEIEFPVGQPPSFAVGAWPAGKNLTLGGVEPIFAAGTKFAQVFIAINDFGIKYTQVEWSV